MKKWYMKYFLQRLLLVMVLCVMFAACAKESDVYLETYVEEQLETEEALAEMQMVSDSEVVASEAEKMLYVYVCGAVLYPDVYSLTDGSRICDAIAAAGGLREDADAMSVNQAELVTDGQMLRIYTCDETSKGIGEPENKAASDFSTVSEVDDRININTATKSQLMTLPGIGSAKADSILAYRTEQGSFSHIEDLMKIPGIKEGIFEQIKECIRID